MTENPDPYERVRRRILSTTADWANGMTLDDIRKSFDAFLEGSAPAATFTPVTIGEIPAAWIEAPRSRPERTLLYCHGGGFQIGSMRSHANLMARLAAATGARILAFDYRLAPEHRFPAAADDAMMTYEWLHGTGVTPDAIVGDSAGGALAVGTAIRVRDAGLPLPGALVLFSPWLDLSMGGESYVALADRDIFSKPAQLQAMARTYLGRGGNPADPAASPVLGDLRGLPPMLVHAGAWDITLDDSRLLVRNAEAQGGSVELRIFDRMFHHFQVFEELPEAAESLSEIAAFLANIRAPAKG